MTIAILATDEQADELIPKATHINWQRLHSLTNEPFTADALLALTNINIEDLNKIKVPIFLNTVTTTLQELQTSKHIVRINGWAGFLKNEQWEIAGTISSEIKNIASNLNITLREVADVPGFVAARTIAMIINEAFFALGDNVSTKKEIDIAMKLGTNYPFGPFEWGQIIGLKNLYNLLVKLSITDCSYLPAPLLQTEAAI